MNTLQFFYIILFVYLNLLFFIILDCLVLIWNNNIIRATFVYERKNWLIRVLYIMRMVIYPTICRILLYIEIHSIKILIIIYQFRRVLNWKNSLCWRKFMIYNFIWYILLTELNIVLIVLKYVFFSIWKDWIFSFWNQFSSHSYIIGIMIEIRIVGWNKMNLILFNFLLKTIITNIAIC